METLEVCCLKGCDNAAFSRGLCSKHYMAAKSTIDKGETSWGELERLRMSKPAKKRGKSKGYFGKLVEDARKAAKGKAVRT